MTTLMLNVKDESKVQHVLSFLSDIPFLEVVEQKSKTTSCTPGLLCGNGSFRMSADFDDELPESFWMGEDV